LATFAYPKTLSTMNSSTFRSFALLGILIVLQPLTFVSKADVFTLVNPDYTTSPYTGMTRKHWTDAARYILNGAFQYVNGLDDPMKFPKQPGKSYPVNASQVPTEKLEGLCRTLFYADPLLKENPEMMLHGIKVADYYRHQISLLVDPRSPSFIRRRAPNGGPQQNLVEFGALALSFLMVPEVLWQPLSQGVKDSLAATMLSYGDGPTVPSNWKFFNIFVLSFFKQQGYTVNEVLLKQYLDQSLAHYRGNGWYNDNPAFDYYSMWAFQMYGVLWSEWFGRKFYPEYAKQFMENFKPMKSNYPFLFARNGDMIMWGRSISYRYAAAVPFPMMGFENDPSTNYGWMRRIASGTLLQFLTNPGFMQDNVPTLGFYGPFDPAVQSYSCRGSVYWSGKIALSLLLPANNSFWTAKENEGAWDTDMKDGKVVNTFQTGSDILITNYPAIGASEIRAWCHVPLKNNSEKFRGGEAYNRLSYNSAFPWQADDATGTVAMNYVFSQPSLPWEALRVYTFKAYKDGIYYRDVEVESNTKLTLRLAELPLDNGIIRVDKNTSSEAASLRLGHYALPELDKPIRVTNRTIGKQPVTIIDNGVYQLAMIALRGWDGQEVRFSKGLHPQSDRSAVIDAYEAFKPGDDPLMVTVMLWKKSGKAFTDKELSPVKSISEKAENGSVELTLQNGKVVSFYKTN